jgi:fumarate reductase subunit C
MTEVGVSLALRRKNNLLTGAGKTKRRKGNQPKGQTKVSVKRQPNASLQLFLEGSVLYALCLVLPSITGAIAGIIQSFLEENRFLREATAQVCSLPGLSSFQWCQKILLGSDGSESTSTSMYAAIAPDAGISDVAIVAFLSLSMAIIRLGLVHLLVPGYDQPKRMRALVRCKSIHLLSSQYSGNGTPRPVKKDAVTNADFEIGPPIPTLPGLDINEDKNVGDALDFSSEGILPKSLFPSKNNASHDDQAWITETDECDEGWDVRPDEHDAELDMEVDLPPAVSSGLISSSSAVSFQALLEQAGTMSPRRRESVTQEDIAIFTSPKFATAVFRFFYCSVSCTIALFFFLDADFWPPAVGGSGNTKNCWDLSSVGAKIMESDFDQHNTVLRRFFLLQASYHFHSAAFHLFTALLLWFVTSSSKNKEEESSKFFGFIPSGMITVGNIITLLQHCFAVGLITFIYLFSSLRRLGAIGIFSFDASSWSLHLLQLSINDSSRRVTPCWIRNLRRSVVIPFFCYSRFYMFPFVIGYSALEESQDWLRQLENMLVPGIARYIHGVFVVCFCLVMIMNIIYFQRLVNHPHVSEALQRSRQDQPRSTGLLALNSKQTSP